MIDVAFPDVQPYVPQFFWRFWLSDANPLKHSLDDHRVHIYDVFNNVLSETRRIPEQERTVFQDFVTEALDDGCRSAIRTAEQAFTRLENDVERILADIVLKTRSSGSSQTRMTANRFEVPIPKRNRDQLLRYFIFLRYRNSQRYKTTVGGFTRRIITGTGSVVNARHAWHRVRRRAVLGSYHAFLHHESLDSRNFHRFEGLDCWEFCKAEICIGVASEGHQYVLPDTCFTSLDEDFGENSTSVHLLFPIMPTLALYVLGVQDIEYSVGIYHPPTLLGDDGAVWIDVGVESPSDVHLRNASLLQRNPAHLYFSSLTSIVQAISSYDEFRWIAEHVDFSRLKQRARQKATQEKVTKTLVVKGSVLLVDLTDEVTKIGQDPVCHGGFSDVWKGIWKNGSGNSKAVALKFLRQYQSVATDVREKLLGRLKAEIVAWHRLQHANIAPLYGVIQSANTIAMVSPWCNNGTIIQYIQRENVHPDRLALLVQVASGVSYLHNMKPVVVHGDLKGTNILISDTGDALITDFGLSNVVEELSLTDATLRAAKLGTSLLAGSTRWMAPELILTLVEDDEEVPPLVTTESDVYSFACVCLEVATGALPYSHRKNDHAVTIDIMRGVKPSRGAPPINVQMGFAEKQEGVFWDVIHRCWNALPALRPAMSEVKEALAALKRCS